MGDVDSKVDNTVAVSDLIVVPRDELDEVVVEGDTSSSIKDGRASVTEEVSGDGLVLGVAENTLQGSLRGLLDCLLDLVVRSSLLKANSQVDDGDVEGRDTEGHTGELAVEVWEDLADGLGSTSGGGDDVGRSRTTSTPVTLGRSINDELRGGGRVDGGHQTLNDTELLVNDLGEGSKAVGGARGVGDHGLTVVLVKVNTADEHGKVRRGSSDDDLLGTTLQVTASRLGVKEHTRGLDNNVHVVLSPLDVLGLAPAQRRESATEVRHKCCSEHSGPIILRVLHFSSAKSTRQTSYELSVELDLMRTSNEVTLLVDRDTISATMNRIVGQQISLWEEKAFSDPVRGR